MNSWHPRIEGRPGPLYRAIADALAEDLHAGRISPGERLPTHRALARRLGVTISTVTRGYAEAERRGLLSGEVGRGSFVRRGLPDYRRFAIDDAAEPYALHVNHPPPVATRNMIQDALAAVLEDAAHDDRLRYMPHAGRESHRAAASEWLGRRRLEAPMERILVCAGGQHALTVSLAAVCQPGDLVLAEELTFPGFKAAARLLGLRAKGVAMDREGLCPDALDRLCATQKPRALYTVPTLHNPTTRTLSAERRRAVAEVVRTHGLTVLEDDVYGFLDPEAPAPLARDAPEHTFYVQTTAKSIAPGLRIAYLLVPAGRFEAAAAAIRATVFSAAPLMAEIAARWILDGTAAELVERRRREARARQRLARDLLAGQELESQPFAYHLWWHLPAPLRAAELVAEAERRGVRIQPAEAFAVSRAEATAEAVRVSLGAVEDRDTLQLALMILAGLPGGSSWDLASFV